MEKYKIEGKIFKNKKGLEFKVLEVESINANKVKLYKVVFLKSGYVAHNVSSGHIRNGEVKDYFSPSVFGVGCLGYADGYAKRNESRRLYYTWRGMLRRCYDPSYSKFPWYGGKRIKVCERWHRLDYFIEDVIKLPGYNQTAFEASEIELDKDFIDPSKKEYSPETCSFLSHKENNRIALAKRWHPEQFVS